MERDDDLLEDLEQRMVVVQQLRTTTRRSLMTSGWPVLVLWGIVFCASVPLVLATDGATGWYWAVAVPLGIAGSFAIGWRSERTVAADGPWWPYVVVSAVMAIGGTLATSVMDADPGILVWWLVLVGGFAALSILDGHRAVALGLGVLAMWGLVVWWSFPGTDDVVYRFAMLAGTLGVYLLGVGFAFRTVRS